MVNAVFPHTSGYTPSFHFILLSSLCYLGKTDLFMLPLTYPIIKRAQVLPKDWHHDQLPRRWHPSGGALSQINRKSTSEKQMSFHISLRTSSFAKQPHCQQIPAGGFVKSLPSEINAILSQFPTPPPHFLSWFFSLHFFFGVPLFFIIWSHYNYNCLTQAISTEMSMHTFTFVRKW